MAHCGQFWGKIEIFSIHISSVGNLQQSFGKLQLPALLPTFLTRNATLDESVRHSIYEE